VHSKDESKLNKVRDALRNPDGIYDTQYLKDNIDDVIFIYNEFLEINNKNIKENDESRYIISDLRRHIRDLEKNSSWFSQVIMVLTGLYEKSPRSFFSSVLPAYFTTRQQIRSLKRKQLFDADYYMATYPDVAAAGFHPLRHYVSHGVREGRASGGLSGVSNVIIERQTDNDSECKIVETAIGKDLGRAPSGHEIGAVERNVDGLDPHIHDVISSGFSTDFYLSAYPDIRDAGVDPVWHYAVSGWIEGRDPSLNFSTRYYLETYPDVREAGVNPFYHYLASGKSEGRAPKHELGFRYDILAQLKPVAEQIAAAKANRPSVQAQMPDALCAAITSAMDDRVGIILSFSHDDFMRHIGGVQLLLRRELSLLQDRNILQINFYPIHPLLFMDASDDDILLGVTINGQNAGAYLASDVVKAMRAARFASVPTFVIHNLLGHNVNQAIAILEAAGAKAGHWWIHDFAPLYNNYKLMRNDVAYDGMPKPGTMAWQLCEYARADFSHRDLCIPLFEKFSITLLAPSQSALDIWNKADVLQPVSSQVIEHCTLRNVRSLPPVLSPKETMPLKVGYLGHPSDHKGWGAFRELVLAFADDQRYEFHHLGSGRGMGLPVASREVHADEVRPDRMREAVELEELDVALVWSLWPETFCLVAYEAIAGGAAILTNKAAGNVCDLVVQTGEGLVLDDEKTLHEFFASGKILTLARAQRDVHLFDMEYSQLTVTCLEQQS